VTGQETVFIRLRFIYRIQINYESVGLIIVNEFDTYLLRLYF